jgi:hypothetical protein
MLHRREAMAARGAVTDALPAHEEPRARAVAELRRRLVHGDAPHLGVLAARPREELAHMAAMELAPRFGGQVHQIATAAFGDMSARRIDALRGRREHFQEMRVMTLAIGSYEHRLALDDAAHEHAPAVVEHRQGAPGGRDLLHHRAPIPAHFIDTLWLVS